MALNYVTFNQDNTLLAVGTSKGFRLFTTEPFSKYYENEEGDISIMEMLFSTSLVAMVLSPRLLRILNTKRNTTICELTFPMKILGIKMNRKRLAVVLEESIYLYDITNMKHLQTIETSPNPHALCVLSPSSDNNYMCYPQPSKQLAQPYPPMHAPPGASNMPPSTGEVLIFDANSMESINVIEAHQSTLGALSINNTGSMLASASEKGTIIRVFSIPTGEKLFHFRRGSLPASIYCMTFNSTSSLLSVSSATETVHIFKLVAQQSPFRPSTSEHQASSPTSPSINAPTTNPIPTPGISRARRDSLSSIDHSRDRDRDRDTSPFWGSETDQASSPEGTPSNITTNTVRGTAFGLASILRRTSQNVGLSLAQKVGEFLPQSVTEMWEPARDFAWVKIPRLGSSQGVGNGKRDSYGGASAANSNSGMAQNTPVKSIVAMSANLPHLIVVTSEGQCLVYRVDLEKGGEAVLEKNNSVLARRLSEAFTTWD